MAEKKKRNSKGAEGPGPYREHLTKPVPAELTFDADGNHWVLKYFVEARGLTLKILVKSAGTEDTYEHEVWRGTDRILSSNEPEWYHRMRAEFSDCIGIFDGMRQRWLLHRDATDSAWKAFFPKAESFGSARPGAETDAYRQWGESIQHEFAEMLERASKMGKGLVTDSIEVIASAVEAKDPSTLGHSQRVARYTVVLAEAMGLKNEEIEKLRISAILHDVGKIGIEARILTKPGILTNEEFEIMKRHALLGFEMVRNAEALKVLPSVVRWHHERYDGEGYPDGLSGDMIPVGARIVAVANAFDAMTTDHAYGRALPIAEARERIAQEAGKNFDPEVVRAFLSIPEEIWKRELQAFQ